ncbi:MAG: T9SS type A sorting domain-containing protein [Patescibacteria group bacterium]
MKKLVKLTVMLIILSMSASAQKYVLEEFYQHNDVSTFFGVYISGNSIWGYFTGGQLFVENGQMNFLNQPSGDLKAGFKNAENDYVLRYVSGNGYCYSWNNETKRYDEFASPVKFLRSSFVYSKDSMYICSYDDFWKKTTIYLWKGEESFEEIFVLGDSIYIDDLHVKSPDEIIFRTSTVIKRSILRLKNGILSEIFSDSDLMDGESIDHMKSIDGVKIFVRTNLSNFYLWDDDLSQLSLVYEAEEIFRGFISGLFIKDNDNIFISGSGGLSLLNISSGTENKIIEFNPNFDYQNGLFVRNFFHDKETDQIYFCYGRGIYKLAISTSIAEVYPEDLTIHQKGSGVYLVDNPKFENASLSIYNVSGVKLRSLALEAQTEIDLSGLSSGVYIFVMQTPTGLVSRRVLKP